jgi:hypothetical protein
MTEECLFKMPMNMKKENRFHMGQYPGWVR